MCRLFASALSHFLKSNFVSSSPVFSISFYLPFFAFHVCRLIHKSTLCFVVHVVLKFFSQTQLAMQFPTKQNAPVSAVGHVCIFRRKRPGLQHRVWVSHSTMAYIEGRKDVRTYVRRTDSDVITKIFRIRGFTKISYQWGSARAPLKILVNYPIFELAQNLLRSFYWSETAYSS